MSASVSLSKNWGWEFHDNHLKKSFCGIDPFLENVFHQMFTLEFHLVILHCNTELGGHSSDFLQLAVHGGFTSWMTGAIMNWTKHLLRFAPPASGSW